MAFHKGLKNIDGIALEVFTPEQQQHPVPLLFVHGSSCGSWLWDNFLQFFLLAAGPAMLLTSVGIT
jgi:pimeloyl-ACP methyl ester carboxylesterase